MKKGIVGAIITVFVLGCAAGISLLTFASNSNPFEAPTVIRCTCYTDAGTTASGQQTRPGIIAGKSEWMGCAAALYDVKEDGSIGDFIGYYEVLDTGAGIDTDGDGCGDSIINGQSIDVWLPDDAAVSEWQREHKDYVYILLIPGVG